MEKKVNLKIDTKLWSQVKSDAALLEQTVNQWVIDAIEAKLKRRKNG